MSKDVFIGLDCGTGGVLAMAKRDYPSRFPKPGWVEQNRNIVRPLCARVLMAQHSKPLKAFAQ